MFRARKFKTSVFASLFFIFTMICTLKTPSHAKALSNEPTAHCLGIANDGNNNVLSGTNYRTLLTYDVTLGSNGNDATNVVSTTGQGITLNDVKLSEIPDAVVDYAHGSTYLQIKIPQAYQDAITEQLVLEVAQGTTFQDQVLDSSKFMLENNKWKKINAVEFSQIRWNNIGYDTFDGYKGVLLEFNKDLSTNANEIGGGIRKTNLASTIGEHIYLGDAKLSTLPGAVVSYYSTNLLFVYADNMSTYRTLRIEGGTIVLSAILPELKLHFDSKNKWELGEHSYESRAYSGITWNNMDYDFFGGRKGLLLNFGETNKYLSNIPSEYNGGLKGEDLTGTISNHVYIGGKPLSTLPGAFVTYHSLGNLFIYADGMSAYRTFRIEEGTKFLDSILPEVNLSFVNTAQGPAWAIDTVEYTEVTYDGIAWNNTDYDFYGGKKGILLKFQNNKEDITNSLSNIANELNGNIRDVNFAPLIGDQIYLGDTKLSELPGALVSYYQLNNLFIYADSMTAYRSLHIEEGIHILDSILPEINLYVNDSFEWGTNERTKTPVTFKSFVWNNAGHDIFEGKNGVLIEFSGYFSKFQFESDGGIRSTNFAASLGKHIYLGEEPLSNIPDAIVAYHSQGNLFIYTPNMTSVGTLLIEDVEFLDVILTSVELYFRSGKWSTDYIPVTEVASCKGIANDINNNILEAATGTTPARYRTILSYDVTLGATANNTNVVSTTGKGILLNGVALSEIPDTVVDYAHGSHYLQIKIPQAYQDALTGDIILEVLADTPFENKVLDYAKFELVRGQWVTWAPRKDNQFASIFWNNTGADVYEGKEGLLLSYKESLSDVPKERNGSLKLTNLIAEDIGSKLSLDGTPIKNINGAEVMYFGSSFLWIYVPNMTSYKVLTMEEVRFLSSNLPSLELRLIGNKWAETIALTHTINGVEKVEYHKKNNGVVIDEEYYQSMFLDENLSVKLVNFEIGDKVYKGNESLTVYEDTEIKATLVGIETTDGASIRMTGPTSMRFETKIDKESYDYLINQYGKANIETGTYIVPKDSLGSSSFDRFVKDSANELGKDYFKRINSEFDNQNSVGNDGYYKYFGVLENIDSKDITTEYVGIGYIKITYKNQEFYVYGGDNNSRSIYEVVKRAYTKYDIGTYQNDALKEYLDSVVSLVSGENGIEIENPVEGYTSPYSVEYDNASKEYTISGNGVIKSVLMNGKRLDNNSNLIVDIGEDLYKITDFELNKLEDKVMAKFKVSEVSKALDMVDFAVEMPSDRDMRILQITDTQIIDSSQMRRPDRLGQAAIEMWARDKIDENCFDHIRNLIEKENPDLIIFTGDIVYGEFDDSGEIWTMMLNFMDSFGIPWAPVFGNHDNETYKGVNWQCEQLEACKNCLFKQGNLSGNGNYSVGFIDEKGMINRVMYMLDSKGCLEGPGIATNQVDWMKSVSSTIDGAYGAKVPAFACFHIPTLDFENAFVKKYGYAATASFDLEGKGIDGDFGAKNENLSKIPTSFESTFKQCNIDGVFAGHDHVNNYSILYNGIRYTYGVKTGVYDYYNAKILGGTLINVSKNGDFEVSPTYVNENGVSLKQDGTKITVMSDLHHDTNDYGGFHCLKTKAKFNQIMSETQDSDFYINLGDTVNSCVDSLVNYYDMMALMKENGLNVYNPNKKGYEEGNRMMYNLLGNHEVAYSTKDAFKDYVPYVEGVGSTGVFKEDELLFVAVDALFTRTGSDSPSDILPTTEFMISDAVINYLKQEVSNQMDNGVKGIVWISHVALQDIDTVSKAKLLNELKAYNLPMTVLEGHTHVEAYHELTDETGKVYCEVYTLPAVVLNDEYKYYNVYFSNGKVSVIDKKNGEIK